MRIAGKLAAGVVGLGVALVIADMREGARARRAYLEGNEELITFRAALNAEATHADIRRWANQTRHLVVLDLDTNVSVETPFAASTPRAILWLTYRRDRLCSVTHRAYDENGIRLRGDPPDLTFPCEATGSVALTLAASLALTADTSRAVSSERCSAAFAARRLGGHDFRTHPEVIRVREVRGTITSAVGAWPAATPVLFQVFGPASRPIVRTATAGSDGAFRVSRVPAGTYCFEASANGWDPFGDLLEVSNKNPSEATISLSLPLAM
jgi:hypothetical protein